MNLFQRLAGTFFSPQPTFKALAERPKWLDALVVLLVLFAVFSYLTAPYTQKDQAELMRSSARLKERMGEDMFNKRLEALNNPSPASMLARALIISPLTFLVGLLLSGLVLLGMGRLVSTQGNYKHVVSALAHASFVDKLLGNAVRLFLIISKKSAMQASTSLALLFPRMEVTSAAYVILGQIDFFQLWLFGILAYGLAHIFSISMKKALLISYGFWLIKSLLYIGLGLFGLQYMR